MNNVRFAGTGCVPLHPNLLCLDYAIVLPPSMEPALAWIQRADDYQAFDLHSVNVQWDGKAMQMHAIVKFRSVEQRDAYLDALR